MREPKSTFLNYSGHATAFLKTWRPIRVRQTKKVGTAIRPHLFRDCMLTSLAEN
jgi:hypothetical protein